MLIAIPSKGRPGKVKSLDILPSATLFIPEYEAEDYAKFKYRNIVPVPREVKGITQTRNWILKNTDDEEIVFIDDDVRACGWKHIKSHHMEHTNLTEMEWIREFEKLFEVAYGMNFRLWGIATTGEIRAVYPYKPFLWNSYVTASCCGILNDGRTYFDESFQVKEDYELCLRLIKEDGGIVGARHIFWENVHWQGEGGCKDYRTQEIEENCINKLKKMYPGMIRQITKGGSSYSISIN